MPACLNNAGMIYVSALAISVALTTFFVLAEEPRSDKSVCATHVRVVELKDYKFTAKSFLDERPDLAFKEIEAPTQYRTWAQDAVKRVNLLVPEKSRLCEVKFKLIFEAQVKSPDTQKVQVVPVSIIESYQEPKTNSVRLGMLEMKDDEVSFKDTVAHEYAHLIFENASRGAGTTKPDDDAISFWPKSVYEGVADLAASLALETTQLGSKRNWSARNIHEFSTLEEAKKSKTEMISKARKAFRSYGLIPKYPIYEDWLKRIGHFIEATGGVDPYAEGVWLAGALQTKSNQPDKKRKIMQSLVARAKSGSPVADTKIFYDSLAKEISE